MSVRTKHAATAAGPMLLVFLITACSPPAPIEEAPTVIEERAPGATGDTAQTAAEARAIPEGEIPARADLVAASLRRIEALIEPNTSVTAIYEDLARRELRIEALHSELDRVSADTVTTRRLQDMRLPWLKIQAEMTAWRHRADARFDALRAEREYLREVRARWEATRDGTPQEELGAELASRVQEVLARVIDVETRVRARRDIVASVIDRIAASQEAITDALEKIDRVDGEIMVRALLRDKTPLWQSPLTFADRSFRDETVGAGRTWAEAVVNYLTLYPQRLLLLLAIYAAALATALRARRRSRALPVVEDEELKRGRALMERPFSVALAGTLVASMFVLPAASGSASDIQFALIVIPVTRLGSVLLEGAALRALWAIVLLTFVTAVVSISPDGFFASRVLLLAVTGAAALTATLTARASRYKTPPQGWRLALPLIAAVLAFVLYVALAANVLGWVNLSRRLTRAAILSAFGGAGWAIVVAAFAALLPAIIAGRLGDALGSLRRNESDVIRLSLRGAGAIALLLWVRATLVRFDLYLPLRDSFQGIAALQLTLGSLTISAGQLIAAAVLLVATAGSARFARFVVRGELAPRLHLRRGVDASFETLTSYLIWALGIALAFSAAGLTGTQLAVVIGALGVGIGFGLQAIVNNFVSGLILMFERPIKVGDAIETPDYFGRVRRIGIRASVIRSYDGAEIVVPNGELISKAVTNWTGTDEVRRVELVVGVAYGTDPEQVLEILRLVAREHPRVVDVPPPEAHMINFGDSSLGFRLRVWCGMEHRNEVRGDLHVAISRELDAAGIVIPFPQRDLHIKSNAEQKSADPPERTE